MKKFLAFLLVSAFLFALVPVVTTVSAASVLDGKKIIFFGDSLTAFPKNGTDRYSDMVQEAFPNSTIINAGVGGDTTYLARMRFQTDVLDKNPDIVFICFGMNDAAKTEGGANYKPIEKYRQNIQNFITALKGIGCDVVLMTPNPVNGPRGDYSRGDHVKYCDVLRQLAVANNVGLVDMYTVYQENGYVSSSYIYDGIHQNAAGRRVYADHIAAYLNAAYNNRNTATITINCVTDKGKTIKTFTTVGAIGTNVRLAPPDFVGCTAISTPVTTTFSTKTITFTYTSDLENAIAKAKTINRSNYADHVLEAIDYYISIGETETDFAKGAVIVDRLNYLITVTGDTELVHSTYLKYTTDPAPNYYLWDNAAGAQSNVLNPLFIDDNVRLADGKKSNPEGYNLNNYYYSVWQSTDVNIFFDFGRKVAIDTVRGYFADGMDGVSKPNGISVYCSDDGISYNKVNGTSKAEVVADSDEWDTHCITIKSDVFTARYVKIVIDTVSWGPKCVWVDEVEVALTDTNADISEPTPKPDPKPEPEPDPEPKPEPTPIGLRGDVNKNGSIDSRDYVTLKRAYFKTAKLDEVATKLADINNNGSLDSRDYVTLKRVYFKTAVIKDDIKYVY